MYMFVYMHMYMHMYIYVYVENFPYLWWSGGYIHVILHSMPPIEGPCSQQVTEDDHHTTAHLENPWCGKSHLLGMDNGLENHGVFPMGKPWENRFNRWFSHDFPEIFPIHWDMDPDVSLLLASQRIPQVGPKNPRIPSAISRTSSAWSYGSPIYTSYIHCKYVYIYICVCVYYIYILYYIYMYIIYIYIGTHP